MGKISFILCLLLLATLGYAQNQTVALHIRNIEINGNDRTHENYIMRQLAFRKGDSLDIIALDKLVRESEHQLFNTSLFLEVKVKPVVSGDQVDFIIELKERWYFFVFPVIELADRSFNEWWAEQNHLLNRVDYGINIHYNNMWGRNEHMLFSYQYGYASKFNLQYLIPFVDRKQHSGLLFSFFHDKNHEVAFNTDSHNKLQYISTVDPLRKRTDAMLAYRYQKAIRIKHEFNAGFKIDIISSSVLAANPTYLSSMTTSQKDFYLGYLFEGNWLDRYFYPNKGFYAKIQIRKNGLGIFDEVNYWQINTEFSWYKPLAPKFTYAGNFKTTWLDKGDFFLNSASLGYNDQYVRSFEYYLVYGKTSLLSRHEIKLKLVEKQFDWLAIQKANKFKLIPVEIYCKAWFDAGYSSNPYSSATNLNNTILYSVGLGLDFVSYYDIVLRLESGINSLGEPGVFLNFYKGI